MANTDIEQISIPKFYAGRHILITGGSGFIGKVLVEKILRSCPDVAGVYLLLREKKGVTPEDRIKAITQTKFLFDELRKQQPNFETKIHAISGDVKLPNLGLSAENRRFLVQNISVVFHGAASVRFDDPLAQAILMNVRGTRDLALMAAEMPNLAIFVHISTTYCNVDRKIIEEKLYPPHGDWRSMIATAEKLDSPELSFVTPKILGFLPNTYTFSKSLAEHCLHDVLKGKPFLIVRPSIVISTFSEPIKGWVDNFNGPVGMMVACGKGILHVLLGRDELTSDYMPVDLVVKVLLIAAYKHGMQRMIAGPPPIYNCSSAVVKPVTMGEIRQMGLKVNPEYPLNDMLWIPLGLLTKSRTVLLIGTLVLHMIPAIIIDAVLRFSGKKPRLVKLQRQIYTAQLALAPFLINAWTFKNDRALLLDKNLPKTDSEKFRFDYREDDVFEYFRSVAIGGRRYLLKESDETLPQARKHRQRIVIINRVVLLIISVGLLYIFPFSRIFQLLYRPVEYLLDIDNI